MVLDKDGVEHEVWIVPAERFAMRYINDVRYLRVDITQEAASLDKRSENNIQLSEGRPWSSPKYTSIIRILSVRAVRDIALCKDLIFYFENMYEFYG